MLWVAIGMASSSCQLVCTHLIGQSGVASSIKEQLSMKQRESVKLKESAKQEPTNHHQCQYSPSSLALFATNSLELTLA